jgi:hypothetical protein
VYPKADEESYFHARCKAEYIEGAEYFIIDKISPGRFEIIFNH